MIYKGVAGIDYLSTQLLEGDPGESSHWRKYHSSFKFSGENFSGLQGFGGNGERWRTPFHRVLQYPFRKMGEKFSQFKSIDKTAFLITGSQRRAYDIDVLRQTLTVTFLRETIPKVLNPSSMGCVIGDGFASTTSILIGTRSAECVVMVNLTKTLLVDLWFLKEWMGGTKFDSQVRLVTDENSLLEVLAEQASNTSSVKVIAIQAKDHHLIKKCPINYTINTASMQEMDPQIIEEYFNDLRTAVANNEMYFYCANREEKPLPDGTVTRFSEYPWLIEDEVKIDELCPWHQFYYAFMPPFYRPYDGAIRHRLVKLAAHLE